MRNRFVLTRIILTLGILLTPTALVRGQEAPEPRPLNEQTVTIAGHVLSPHPLQGAETLAVVLLPGWSDRLSDDITAGMAPMVLLDVGWIERILVPQFDPNGPARPAGAFEFRNIPPGEYQAVAVRIKEGAETGTAIAVGHRVIVGDRDIKNLELQIAAPAVDQPARRPGGAKARESAVLDSVNRPMVDVLPPYPNPIGPTPSTSSSGSRKKELLEQILVTVGLVAAMVAFSLW